jgi:hypothetical protein
MAKKSAKKDSGRKKEAENSGFSHEKTNNLQKILIENFVSLQDVMADLSSKLNNLTNQMSRLLELFEQSAKTFMEKDLKFAGGSDKDLVEKLDRLIEQNKVIARGITLLHEEYSAAPDNIPETMQSQFPQPGMNPSDSANKYQRSLSSKQDAKIQTRQTPG